MHLDARSRDQSPTMSSQSHLTNEPLWKIICIHSQTWRLLLILLIYIAAQMVMLPWIPNLMTNDFARRRNQGESIHCEDYKPSESPDACTNAHGDVVIWSTWSGFAQNAVFSVVLTPALGAWSDIHGRKPLILIAMSCTLIPYLIVLLNITYNTPLLWLYIVQAFTGSISVIAPSLAYIADSTPPRHRASCFGLIMASFSLAILIGPPIGSLCSMTVAPIVTLVVIGVCIVVAWVFLPESLSQSAIEEAKQQQNSTILSPSLDNSSTQQNSNSLFSIQGLWSSLASTWTALSILRRSALFMKLSLILMLSAVVSEGIQDILIQYLQLKLGFGVKDVSRIFMIFGAGALIIQGLLLNTLLTIFGETRLLVIGLFASSLQQLFLALSTEKWQALAAVSLGCLGSITFPTISSIKANNAMDHEQGSVQGALYGARALASGIGPLIFAWLFAGFTRTDSHLPFLPGIPFLLGAAMMMATSALAATLPSNAGGNSGTLEVVFSGDNFVGADESGGIVTRDAQGEESGDDDDDENKSLLLGRKISKRHSTGNGSGMKRGDDHHHHHVAVV